MSHLKFNIKESFINKWNKLIDFWNCYLFI
jgi:hypothetical protein